MEESFDLYVIFKGEQLVFKARLLKYVYTHKIKVTVFDQEILLEPDEERNYRVVRSETQMKQSVEVDLLKAIVNALNDHL